ncbi:MAG: MBOAT family O-acyltransferase [Alkalispirochaeta sp.]
MVFAGPTFLFYFLPLFFLGYALIPFRWKSGWILLGSWLFYGWWRFDFLLLLVAASLGAGVIGRLIAGSSTDRERRRWMIIGVTAALGVLGYFKYFNFGVHSVHRLIERMGGTAPSPDTVWEVVLPVGISFFTFQIISYIVDVYRRDAEPARSIIDVAAYVSLFPQLVAGPIVRYTEIADELRQRKHTPELFSRGVRRFSLGLVRKVLIADAVAPLVTAVFTAESPGFTAAWVGVLAYTVQIYFDFSAYSDMAIGLGLMMGFHFPENFRRPYHSRSITEFWRRWHITLSSWLRDYLYIPLGGNRLGPRRTLVNLMTVMVLGGLWHGAAWTFVAWGAWHGAWLIVERIVTVRWSARRSLPERRGPDGGDDNPQGTAVEVRKDAGTGHHRWSALRRIYTLGVVIFGWVFFRAESFAGAGRILSAMAGGTGGAGSVPVIPLASTGPLVALTVGVLLAAAEPRVFEDGEKRPVLLTILTVLAVARLLAASYSPFLYFQF